LRFRPVGAALAALILAACATATPTPPPVSAPAPPATAPLPPPSTFLDFSRLPGWAEDDHAAAFAAFRETCGATRDRGLAQVCRRARSLGPLDAVAARGFFEANFRAESVGADGVLTAYFAPEYAARTTPDAEFSAPLRARPADLSVVDAGMFDPLQAGKPGAAMVVAGQVLPYPDRAGIEAMTPEQVLAWMRPEELFFLQIQGSGVVTFESGRRMKAVYAANNGKPFVGIANPMRDRGLLAGADTSGEAIRAWLADHRGPEAQAIMQLNPRYVFFSLAPDDGRQPVGSAGVPLAPGRSIAVDPTRHAMGELFWLDARAPILAGAFPAYRRLVMALDTGGAIKGDVRADLYLGLGARAGAEAGRVRHALRLYRLAPLVDLPGGPTS